MLRWATLSAASSKEGKEICFHKKCIHTAVSKGEGFDMDEFNYLPSFSPLSFGEKAYSRMLNKMTLPQAKKAKHFIRLNAISLQ
jgi:hypothetical protein